MDYVEYSYMREIADKHYPGWSWTVIKTEFAGTEAYVVHGRLKWFDNGVWREGDSTAAHRVQKKRGSSDYVDLGNDIKAANTHGTKAGKWSARKAQLLAKKYKALGGGYY